MKRLIAYAFALIITCTPTAFVQGQKARRAKPVANQTANLSAQQIAKRVLPAVGLLICGSGADAVLGSGFFISSGVLVTNYHVIEGNPRCEVRLTVGNTKQRYIIARVLGFDEESDLALLSVPDAVTANVPTVPLLPAGQWPEVGETIYALGNPEGLAGTISPGIVSAGLRDTKKQARLQITAPISHGSSGGPVVNAKGEVVGVAVGYFKEGQNLNFAVPTALVHALLRESNNDIARERVPNAPKVPVPAPQRTDSNNPSIEERREALDLYKQAESLIAAGKAADALPVLQKALSLYRLEQYYYISADAHKSLGNNEKALAMLREGLKMFPNEKGLVLTLASMLADMKRGIEAEPFFWAWVKAYPEESNFKEFCDFYYFRRDWQKVVIITLYWLKIDRTNLTARNYLIQAYNQQGQTHLANKVSAELIAIGENLINLGHAKETDYNELIKAYNDRGQFNDSLRTAQKCMGAYPNKPSAYSALGDALYKLGRYNEAVEAYMREIAIQTKENSHRYSLLTSNAELFLALAKAQRYGEAIDTLDKFVTFGGGCDDLFLILDGLRELSVNKTFISVNGRRFDGLLDKMLSNCSSDGYYKKALREIKANIAAQS